MEKSCRIVLTLCLAVLTAIAFGQAKAAAQKSETKASKDTRDLSNDPQAVDLLRQVEQKYGQVKTVSGRFRQTKVSPPSLEEPAITSYATFNMVKPNKFRADYDPPRKSTNLINGDYSYQYVESIKQLNRYKFQGKMTPRDFNYLLLGFGANTDDLAKVYALKWLTKGIGETYYAVQLIPRDRDSASFKYITILVNRTDLRPAQFSMEQLDGVRITVDMEPDKLQLDSRISGKIFEPNFPVEATDVN